VHRGLLDRLDDDDSRVVDQNVKVPVTGVVVRCDLRGAVGVADIGDRGRQSKPSGGGFCGERRQFVRLV
jgi:hypothetical protein